MTAVPSASRWTYILAGVIFLASVAAYVYLDTHGGDTGGLMVLVGPVIAAMFADAAVRQRLAPVRETVQNIERQTNGVLDERIRTQVKAALAETAGIPVSAEAAPATPEQPAAGEPPSAATLPPGFLGQ